MVCLELLLHPLLEMPGPSTIGHQRHTGHSNPHRSRVRKARPTLGGFANVGIGAFAKFGRLLGRVDLARSCDFSPCGGAVEEGAGSLKRMVFAKKINLPGTSPGYRAPCFSSAS